MLFFLGSCFFEMLHNFTKRDMKFLQAAAIFRGEALGEIVIPDGLKKTGQASIGLIHIPDQRGNLKDDEQAQ
jgi:hypothetical protein